MGDMVVTSRVQWRNALGQFSNRIDRAGEQAIEELSREGAALSAALAPKRRGELSASVRIIGGGASGGWSATAGHAMPQEEGARPHPIEASGAALGNQGAPWGPVKRVSHPGNPATRFMRRAFDIIAPQIAARIKARI